MEGEAGFGHWFGDLYGLPSSSLETGASLSLDVGFRFGIGASTQRT